MAALNEAENVTKALSLRQSVSFNYSTWIMNNKHKQQLGNILGRHSTDIPISHIDLWQQVHNYSSECLNNGTIIECLCSNIFSHNIYLFAFLFNHVLLELIGIKQSILKTDDKKFLLPLLLLCYLLSMHEYCF